MKLTIGAKLTIGFGVVAGFLAIMALYSVTVSQKTLEESIGINSLFLAEEMLKRMDQSIHASIEELRRRSKGGLLQKTILESNADFKKIDGIEEYINQRDREWRSVPKNEIIPFMQELIESDLSHVLRGEFIEFYEKKYGYKVFAEVFVTNRFGVNVAQTGKTSDYRQDDEEWWQIAKEKSFYVSDIVYDESAGTYGIEIGVRIDNEEGDFLGVMKAFIAAAETLREAEVTTKKYETTEIRLITQGGELVYATRPFKFLEDITGKDFFKNVQGESGFFIAREGEREKLFSYVRSRGYRDFEGLQWIFLVSHDAKEILEPAFALRNRMLVFCFILVIMSIVIAFFFSRSFSKPIIKVRDGALEIAQGNLNKKVKVTSRDEVGQLAAAFNEMASKLQESYTGLKKEIAERKRAEERVQELNRELEQRLKEIRAVNKELEAFSYSVSHDLRTPLRAIDGFSQILLEDYRDRLDSEGKRVLNVIRDNTGRMAQLISDLLAFSRLGRAKVKKSKINMEKLARDIFQKLMRVSPERKLKMKMNAFPPADGDEAMIREVLVNLFSNAIKFSRKEESPLIEVGGELKGNENIYYVKDNGVGFDMRYRDKLFGVFQRLHGQEEFEGTGVGLALVQRVIHRHEGRVWAEGKVNEGATFYFTLPKKGEIRR